MGKRDTANHKSSVSLGNNLCIGSLSVISYYQASKNFSGRTVTVIAVSFGSK